MTGTVRAFGLTDAGLVRATNEDAYAMAELASGQRWTGGKASEWSTADAGVLLLVSDGMGGAKAGEVASALSIDAVLRGMCNAAKRGHVDAKALRAVVEEASEKVRQAAQRPDRKGMGATLTAVLLRGKNAIVAQIGDSRAYLLRGGKIGQITHDQSYVQMMVDAGVMTPEEAERSPRKNIILQVMGQETLNVVLGKVAIQKNDRILICSDGLSNVVDDDTISELARQPHDIARACSNLIALTKDGGAPDNVTIILAEVV